MTIEEFYNDNKCNQFFDEVYYVIKHPEVTNFYKEHCKAENIKDKERFYFHWATCGLDMGFLPHEEDLYHMAAFALEEINNNYRHKIRMLKMFFSIIKSTEQDPHVCSDNRKKEYYINILKYVIESIELKDRIQKDAFDD
tara:strand:- start:536 stop:955 length:420 start_codon:yes stop_codon:yes gene_type:complete